MLFLKVLLVMTVIPLIAGALLALVLRETYIRYPLPLGGTIGPRKIKPADEKQENADASVLLPRDEMSDSAIQLISENLLAPNPSTIEPPAEEPTTEEPVPEEPADEESIPLPEEVSVFDGTEHVPEHLHVSSVLESMTSESASNLPGDFESIIEEVSQSGIIMPQDIRDDLDNEDLLALAEALPGAKIDLLQELEQDPELPDDPISPMGKELIGENFDFDALEKQANQVKEAIHARQSFELDVQEDESGTIQVLSPFMFDATPQFADFTIPQTIVPMFSGDWIQESSSTVTSAEENVEQYFFAEESRPMFVRRKTKEPGT